jgi:hypothetical protein
LNFTRGKTSEAAVKPGSDSFATARQLNLERAQWGTIAERLADFGHAHPVTDQTGDLGFVVAKQGKGIRDVLTVQRLGAEKRKLPTKHLERGNLDPRRLWADAEKQRGPAIANEIDQVSGDGRKTGCVNRQILLPAARHDCG